MDSINTFLKSNLVPFADNEKKIYRTVKSVNDFSLKEAKPRDRSKEVKKMRFE